MQSLTDKGRECSEFLTSSHSIGPRATSQKSVVFPLNTQLVFLKKEKAHTTNMFDDDVWIRSLTEAKAITGDIPEGQVTYGAPGDTSQDQRVDPVPYATCSDGVRKYV